MLYNELYIHFADIQNKYETGKFFFAPCQATKENKNYSLREVWANSNFLEVFEQSKEEKEFHVFCGRMTVKIWPCKLLWKGECKEVHNKQALEEMIIN